MPLRDEHLIAADFTFVPSVTQLSSPHRSCPKIATGERSIFQWWRMTRRKRSAETPSSPFSISFASLILLLLVFSPIVSGSSNKLSGHHDTTSRVHVVSRPETYDFERPAKFDVNQELQDSLTSLNQLRMISERATPKNVTAQIGHAVYLHCIVEQVGDKMISWIRLRDFHLLTVGLFTYTSDDRFVIRHGVLQANDWALQIKHVSPVDEGLYECQVNTDPPRSQYYYLHVVVPVAEMVGSPDMFVRAGAIINLTCVISRSPEPPAFVFWYHNDRMINYDYNSVGRGDIAVHKDSERSDAVISRLVIRGARLNDSGNYTCTPSNAEPSSIYVHVLQGEKRQSNRIQNDDGSSTEYAASSGGALGSPGFERTSRTLSSISVVLLTLLASRVGLLGQLNVAIGLT